MQIKQSSAAKVLMFLMVDSTDHVSPKTGLSPTVTLSKNGGAFAAPAGAVSEVANGWYKVAANATDSNTLGCLALHATGTGADPADEKFEIVAFDPDDAAAMGLSRIDATISSRSTLTAAGVWDTLLTAITTVGSIGKLLKDNVDALISSRLATAGYTAPDNAGIDSLETLAAAIKAKTDNLPADPADASDIAASFVTVNATLATIAGYIDTEVAAIKAKTDALPSDPADESSIQASIATLQAFVDTEVAAIKAKTDNLPVDPADASDVAAAIASVAADIAVLAAYVDTEVAAIKAKTDNLPVDPADQSILAGLIAAVETKVDTVDDLIDTEVAAVKAVTDKLNTALELDGAVYRYTTNALEQAPAGGGGGAGAPANPVVLWPVREGLTQAIAFTPRTPGGVLTASWTNVVVQINKLDGNGFNAIDGSVTPSATGVHVITLAADDLDNVGPFVLKLDGDEFDEVLMTGRVTDSFDLDFESSEVLAIKAKTDAIGTLEINFLSPLVSAGEAVIYQGYDYLLAQGQQLDAIVTGLDISAADVFLYDPDNNLSIEGVVDGNTAQFEIPADVSQTLELGRRRWAVQAQFGGASGELVRVGTIVLIVKEGVPPPTP